MFDREDWQSHAEDWEEDEKESVGCVAQDTHHSEAETVNAVQLAEEITQIDAFVRQAEQLCLGTDSKAQALLEALKTGFAEMAKLGAGQTVLFNGSNSDAAANDAYQKWLHNPDNQSRITGAVSADKRASLIDRFKYDTQIMIATEAAAEGVNLQFCSLLVNYDLPWNPSAWSSVSAAATAMGKSLTWW